MPESQEGLKQDEAVVLVYSPNYRLYPESQEGLKLLQTSQLLAIR